MEREVILTSLFNKLHESSDNGRSSSGHKLLNFDFVNKNFCARRHPDFRAGRLADYVIDNSFKESFRDFLSIENSIGNGISLGTWLHFWQLYATNWSDNHLKIVAENCFKLRNDDERSKSKTTRLKYQI